MKKYYQKYRHGVPLIVYCAVYLLWFFYLEEKRVWHRQIIHTALDNYIPFCEWFVIPYFLWFVYIAAVVVYFLIKNKEDYYRVFVFMSVGMTIFLMISTFFPNEHRLRPVVMPRENLATALVEFLYKIDTATNLWPSIHVYNSIGAHLAIVKSSHFENKRLIRVGSFILCSSIVFSTVFLKQHSVFDVVTGLLMAVVMYIVVYRTEFVMNAHRWLTSKRKSRPQIG